MVMGKCLTSMVEKRTVLTESSLLLGVVRLVLLSQEALFKRDLVEEKIVQPSLLWGDHEHSSSANRLIASTAFMVGAAAAEMLGAAERLSLSMVADSV